MSQTIEIKVPDIGGFKGVAIIEIAVKPGDKGEKEQALISLETDKATMEVPSPAAGVVKEMKVKVGDKVSEGSVILLLESSGAAAAPAASQPAPQAAAPVAAAQVAPTPAAGVALFSFSLVALLFRNPQGGQRFSKTPVLILGLALLWAAWIGLDAVISRFFDVSENFEMRWEMWANTLQIIKDFPLFGSGLGTFAYVFPPYRSIHLEGIASHAENAFLQLVSVVGVIGAGTLLVPFLLLLPRAFAGIRNLSFEDPKRHIGIGAMVGILGLVFHSIVERNIQVPANAFLFTFLLAIILRMGSERRRYRGKN